MLKLWLMLYRMSLPNDSSSLYRHVPAGQGKPSTTRSLADRINNTGNNNKLFLRKKTQVSTTSSDRNTSEGWDKSQLSFNSSGSTRDTSAEMFNLGEY